MAEDGSRRGSRSVPPALSVHAALSRARRGRRGCSGASVRRVLAPPRRRMCAVRQMPVRLAWRARLHPDWVTPPDPMPCSPGRLAWYCAAKAPFIRVPRAACVALRMIAAIRAIKFRRTDAQATTLRLIGRRFNALTEGEPRAALTIYSESLAGIPSIGGSRRANKKVSPRNGVGRDAPKGGRRVKKTRLW